MKFDGKTCKEDGEKKFLSAEKRRQSDFNKFEAKTKRRERGTMLEFIFLMSRHQYTRHCRIKSKRVR